MARKASKGVRRARKRAQQLRRERKHGQGRTVPKAVSRARARHRAAVELGWRRMFRGTTHGLKTLPGRRRNKTVTAEDIDRPGKTGAEKRRARGVRGGPAWCASCAIPMRRRHGTLRCRSCGGTVAEPVQ